MRESRHEGKQWFRAMQGVGCGIEAGIGMLKGKFSLGRVLARGAPGTAIWTGWVIFAYNLWQQEVKDGGKDRTFSAMKCLM